MEPFDRKRHEAAVAQCDALREDAYKQWQTDVDDAWQEYQNTLLRIEEHYAALMGLT